MSTVARACGHSGVCTASPFPCGNLAIPSRKSCMATTTRQSQPPKARPRIHASYSRTCNTSVFGSRLEKSEVVASRFRQFNPLISRRPRRLQGVLFCCLTKLCIIPPSMAVKKKMARHRLDLA